MQRIRAETRNETRTGLKHIVIAWAFGSVFYNVTTGAPLAAYARMLGASHFVWGVISAAPTIGAVTQIVASYRIERTRRRKPLFMFFGLAHRLLWFPIALLPWFMPEGSRALVTVVTGLIVTASLCSHLSSPSFMSWMSDLVPLKVRGAFFARRMRIGTLMALASSAAAGAALDRWPRMSAYTIVLCLAAAFGTLDILNFVRVPEPPMDPDVETAPLWRMARVPFADPAFRRFLAFSAASAFSINFMAPFLWLFVMERIGMGKLAANLTLLGANLAAVALVSPVWGRLIDRFGNRPVLRLCMTIVALSPVCWIAASAATAPLLWAVVFVSGAFGAGVDLANFNLLLTLFPRERRSIYMALFALLTGLSAGIAPMLAGALADAMRSTQWLLFGHAIGPYRVIFLISLVGRLFATLVLLPRIREPNAGSTKRLLRTVTREWRERAREAAWREWARRPRQGERTGLP